MYDLVYKQSAINATWFDPIYKDPLNVLTEVRDRIKSLPSVRQDEDCDTCKHGYFGSDACNNCRVRYPSHYERMEEQNETN